MMAAFVGQMSSYNFFEWACEAGICKPGDDVTRFILDIGIDDVVKVYVEMHGDDKHVEVRLPEIQHVRRVDKRTTRVVRAKDGMYVKELTDFGREFAELNAENTRLRKDLAEARGTQ
jgi:hypothetical protein